MQDPPPGQGPIDPQGAFSPPPPPPGGMGPAPTPPPHGQPGVPPPFYPPPMMMMPPYMYPPPAQRGKSFARAIFTTLATTIFGISILLNLYLIAASGLLSARGLQRESTVQSGDPTSRIVVLPVTDIINDKSYERFAAHIKTVEDDKTVKAMIVEVNSPGGSVTASDEIYQELLRYKKKTGKPVVIYQRGLAASGGYYVSCAGDAIIAQRTTMTGNIGVLLPRYNLTEMLDKWGVKDTTLRSQHSPYKNVPSMTLPDTPEGNAYLQAIIDDAYDQFAAVVQTGRGAALKAANVKDVRDVANGKIYLADEALKLGLVDQVGDLRDAVAEATRRANLTGTPSVIQLQDPPSIMDLLSSRSPAGQAASPVTGGIDINAFKLDAGSLRELLVPRLMYLWDGH